MSFIKKVVKEVLSETEKIDQLTFVLPTKRSCVFLESALIAELNSATFLPRLLTIEEFLQELAELEAIDSTQLLFEFYRIYLTQTPKKEQVTFDFFTQWAPAMLNDFNEIDSHLVNTNTLFSNLRDVKRLNDWFENEEPTKLAVNYLHFFDSMKALYDGLTQELIKNHHGYNGLIQRLAAKNLSNFLKQNQQEFVFVGFNALTKAEEKIFQQLLEAKLAKVYWDASEEMMKNNAAGKYLRTYKNTWKFYQNNEFKWTAPEKDNYIEVAGAPKNVSQFKQIGELLKNINPHENIALVLGDETQLPLAINSIPEEVKQVNVTMGVSLQQTPIANLFEVLFKLHLNQEKFNKSNQNEYYYKDLIKLLNHPWIVIQFKDVVQKLSEYITDKNLNFVSIFELQNLLSTSEKEAAKTILKLLLPESRNVERFNQNCREFLLSLKPFVDELLIEQLFQLHQIFEKLEKLEKKYGYLQNLKTLHIVFNKLLKQSTLTFKGAPLEGLQVMGLLETRAINFEKLVIASVNEGLIPKKNNTQSFIPYDLKKYFGIPTEHDKSSIFAYHFYRLISNAKEVYITYNSETSLDSGEKSRFITELEVNKKIHNQYLITPKIQVHTTKEQLIQKTPEVMEKLKSLCKKGLTPSAINTYNENPILFYEKYIMNIERVNEVEETIAENTMGTVIHEVLYELYRNFIGKFLIKDDLKKMEELIEPLLMKSFGNHFKKGNLHLGKNKLIFEICKANIKRFLTQESKSLENSKKLKIIALEEQLKIILPGDTLGHEVYLRGIVDRIDEFDGETRIIDYKTGKVNSSDLKFSDYEKLRENPRYYKAFQVMMYAYLFTKSIHSNQSCVAGIFSFKNLNEGFLCLNFNSRPKQFDTMITKEKMNNYEELLTEIIKELMDDTIPFLSDSNKK